MSKAKKQRKYHVASSLTGFRLPIDLLARVDAYREVLEHQTPGSGVTRTAAVRVLLTAALDAAGVKA